LHINEILSKSLSSYSVGFLSFRSTLAYDKVDISAQE